MTKVEKIEKAVGLPYPLKYFFAPASDEFSRITFEQKIEWLKAVVTSGFSTYDLSERFRSDRSDRYDHEDMHSAMRLFVSKLIFGEYHHPFVNAYYEDLTDQAVATQLDRFLINPISDIEFEEELRKKRN